ncbi:MAG: hypothetical protein JXA22_10060 [Candidatus Thermoplasmatota archaeon]|nr:hypothetical protein [Candidatus Thermoplasmatota archaeon]
MNAFENAFGSGVPSVTSRTYPLTCQRSFSQAAFLVRSISTREIVYDLEPKPNSEV